jgi:signal transduction histidine kinase
MSPSNKYESLCGVAAVNRPTVVIVSDVPEFSATATRRWLSEPSVPSFVLAESNSPAEFSEGNFDLAVIGGVSCDALTPVLDTLKATGRPFILISKLNGNAPQGLITIPEAPGWPDLLVTIADQILERERINAELAKTLETLAKVEQQASLGRYMLEARHNLNNALTSILGNSDLILLDPSALPSAQRSQVETIRNMALRLNEIMRRFSSLQKEMQLMEQQGKKKPAKKSAAAGV